MDLTTKEYYPVFIKCINDGKFCSKYATLNSLTDWIIHRVWILEIDVGEYSPTYGKDTYYNVDIYHTKLDTPECFGNGYMYYTSRVIKRGDLLKYIRKEKLERLNEKV